VHGPAFLKFGHPDVTKAPMASSNSPTLGHPKLPQARQLDYGVSVRRCLEWAGSGSRVFRFARSQVDLGSPTSNDCIGVSNLSKRTPAIDREESPTYNSFWNLKASSQKIQHVRRFLHTTMTSLPWITHDTKGFRPKLLVFRRDHHGWPGPVATARLHAGSRSGPGGHHQHSCKPYGHLLTWKMNPTGIDRTGLLRFLPLR